VRDRALGLDSVVISGTRAALCRHYLVAQFAALKTCSMRPASAAKNSRNFSAVRLTVTFLATDLCRPRRVGRIARQGFDRG
jgi:hypothetical protein